MTALVAGGLASVSTDMSALVMFDATEQATS